MPGIIAGLLLVFIPLAGDYITASVLGGAKGNMAGALVASQFLAAQNWALGSAMAVVLIVIILGTIAVAADRRARSLRRDHAQGASGSTSHPAVAAGMSRDRRDAASARDAASHRLPCRSASASGP